MAHTRKHLLSNLFFDTKNFSLDVSIYTSGGVLHTAEFEIIDNDGKTVERWRNSKNSRAEIYEMARRVGGYFESNDSIYAGSQEKEER